MLSIKVLGPGCMNCERVEQHALEAVEQMRERYQEMEVCVEKVTDTSRFLDYGLLATPGLVIDEKLVSAGRIPAPEEIVVWLEEALKC